MFRRNRYRNNQTREPGGSACIGRSCKSYTVDYSALTIIQVLHNSLDSLIISDGSADEGAEQMKMLYLSCPPEMQETLLNNTKRLTEELISLSKKLEKE